MATTLLQLAGTNQSLLTTELNSLASTAMALGSQITLTSAGYPFGRLELVASFAVSPSTGGTVYIWFLTGPDATNYEDGGSSVQPARYPDAVITVRSVTGAQRIVVDCQLPPGAFKALLNNNTGQAMAASGNTVKVLPYTYQQS